MFIGIFKYNKLRFIDKLSYNLQLLKQDIPLECP